jgi:predicted phosphodiesterase
MNKTVILGDTHGRDCWKQIVASESPDRVIFIGDYFDSFDNTAVEQMHNFQEIIDWKQSGQSEVIMLIGNHDYHYMRGITQYYSGYQSGARPAIEQLLYENKNHMQMAYGMNGFIFTHAGVSSDWLKIHGYDNESNLIDWINDMWKYKPNVFSFAGRDPYGDSKISSPIWIRPYSLQAANRDTLRDQFIQVVGHTTQGKIDTEGKSTGGRYYYIDTLGTSGQYMILEQISTDNGTIKFNTYKR